jgi:hypothetical protein
MNRLSENRLAVEYDGEELLAIRTGVEPRRYISQQITAAARRGGILVKNGHVAPWPVRRVVPVDNEYYLVGPMVSGETVEELLPAAGASTDPSDDVSAGASAGAAIPPPRAAPPWLPSLLAAIRFSLTNPDYQFCSIRTSLVTEDNAVLLLDAGLSRDIVRNISADQRASIHEPYHDPSLTGTAAVVYSAAALLYHALTGVVPRRIDQERTTPATPLHALQPAIDADIAIVIDGVLTGSEERTAESLHRIETSRAKNGNSWFEDLSPEEAERRRTTAAQQLAQGSQQNRRRTFWRRYRTRILVTAAVVILIGSVPVSMIRSHLQPPLTAGMTPMEVAEGFYNAWNNLDHQFMQDALAAGVGRDAVREVTNIYVIDRVQTAHEMRGRFRSPEDWIAEGRPENTVPYGVADLRARELRGGDQETTIQIDYEMWRPDTNEDEVSMILRTRLRDTLVLVRGKHSWEITDIRTRVISEERITPGDGDEGPSPGSIRDNTDQVGQ